jgi:hypothetical protein
MKLHRISAMLLSGVTIMGAATAAAQQATSSTTDPRAGLKAGKYDAGIASKGLTLVSTSPRADTFMTGGSPRSLSTINSDFVFRGNYLYQGNFSGFQIWDISNPGSPVRVNTTFCPTDQGDPSIWGNLLFISDESGRGRIDCGTQGIMDSVSKDRARGVRIFDVSDPRNPKQLTVIQTCRGTHTHTLVPDPKNRGVVYIWGQGTSNVRSQSELAGCKGAPSALDSMQQFRRIEVVRVPLAHPERWSLVSEPRIFDGLGPRPPAHGNVPGDTLGGGRGNRGGGDRGRGGNAPGGDSAGRGRGGRAGGGRGADIGPAQCHDITVYPAIHLAAGACISYGLLLDIADPVHPKRLQAVTDSNFALWHSATFSNDGSKLLFTDEWGGGTSPRCRAIDPLTWGGDVVFDLKNKTLTQGAFYKMPAAQTETENCVAHNGGLLPVPGRDILVQGWYQGGISMVDFSDAKHPFEIGYFDRGPINADTLYVGGSWGAYYYNGHVYSSEIYRGLDVLDLTPTEFLSQNEIDAARLVHFDQLNPQSQSKIVWPAAFPVARSYLDQLVRGNGLATARTSAIASDLDSAEKLSGSRRKLALRRLAAELDRDAVGASDAPRVRAMAGAVRSLASAAR